jgi:hypothetical protein
MRLIDALDQLKVNSGGYVSWRLLEGRIVYTIYAEETLGNPVTLDRRLNLDIAASELGEALMALEAAWNSQYRDRPLLISCGCANVNLELPLTPQPLRLSGTMTVRNALIEILKAANDPWMTYTVAENGKPGSERVYWAIRISVKPCRSEVDIDVSQIPGYQSLDETRARLEGYFEVIRREKETADREPLSR